MKYKQDNIYIAGGWFSDSQIKHLKEIENYAQNTFKNVFCPRLVNKGVDKDCDWDSIFDKNISHLDMCDLVIASTIDKDMGTIWECGYGFAKGKQIVYYTPGIDKPNLMLGKSGIICKTIEEIDIFITKGIKPKIKDFE